MRYICNICGNSNGTPVDTITRESASCSHCGSNERFRSLVYLLSKYYFDQDRPLSSESPRKEIKGIGMSDQPLYAKLLERVFDYRNTYYHQEPHLDIMDVPTTRHGEVDFIVSSDVLEHVGNPVQKAFDNCFKLLKSGGILFLTVPFTLEGTTLEHFPSLHDFQVDKTGEGRYVLTNRTRDGRTETFNDLIFHGGPGQTLEMRVFSENSLRQNLRNAGFNKIEFFRNQVEKFGIVNRDQWSLPVTAKKP